MKLHYKQNEIETFKGELGKMVERLNAEPYFRDNNLTFEYELEPRKFSDAYVWCFAVVGGERKAADAYLIANSKNGKFKVVNNHDFFTKNFDEAVEKLESVLKGEYYSGLQIDKISNIIEGKIELLKDKTNYTNIRGPPDVKLPRLDGGELSWVYAYDVPDKPDSTSGIEIYLNNRTGIFTLTGGKMTKSVRRAVKSIEDILLDERGRKE